MPGASSKTFSHPALKFARRAAAGVLDLVYPPLCVLCDQRLWEEDLSICEVCREELLRDPHPSCPRCAETIGPFTASEAGCVKCAKQDLRFDAAFRLGSYDGLLQRAILQIKHAFAEDLAEDLGRVLARQLQWGPTTEQIDAVVPVPLHWFRRLQRGYNQAEALSRSISRELALPLRPRWLARRHYTSHQAGQSRTARQQNLHGAFVAAPRAGLKGKRILLVDDVMTTCSTCSEAARALKQAGAASVVVAVLARKSLA
jgi:ComF family protein